MPYVQRDANGLVTAIFQKPQENASELLPSNHPDVQKFLGGIVPQTDDNAASAVFQEKDGDFIRVIEDIIDVLIDKNLIRFTDLPAAAREKFIQRKSMREHLLGSANLIDPEDQLF